MPLSGNTRHEERRTLVGTPEGVSAPSGGTRLSAIRGAPASQHPVGKGASRSGKSRPPRGKGSGAQPSGSWSGSVARERGQRSRSLSSQVASVFIARAPPTATMEG